jgi:hypothetical protein
LRKLLVTKGWDGLWSLIRKENEVFFLSVAFDLSGQPPFVMPPSELKGHTYVRIPQGSGFEFTLGDGAPLFLPRQVVGGIAPYLTFCEADSLDEAGKALTEVHNDLKDNSG